MLAMTPQTFVFIGRSGCGKGTQVELLKKYLEEKGGLPVFFLENGQRFRDFAKREGNYTSDISRDTTLRGGLQPAFLAVHFWASGLIEGAKKDEHWMFDGICRRPDEAPMFAEALKFYGREGDNVHVVYVNVGKEWAIDKLLKRGRGDDTRESIEKRMGWFDRDVVPALEFLKKDSGFHYCDINGEQTVEQVHAEIMKLLGYGSDN